MATGNQLNTVIDGNVSTWLETPSSANLATAVSDETGSGSLVFGTSPVLTTPNLGTPSALTLTNATDLPVSGLANGTDGELITWDAAGAPTTVAVGTAGQVLTSAGAGAPPTFETLSVEVSELASGTDGELITWDASGNPATVSTGTSGQVLTSNGAGAAPTFQAIPDSGATFAGSSVATTSGTAVGITGLPSGIKRLTLIINAVSASLTANFLVRIGDSGGYETSGYVSNVSLGTNGLRSTNGFYLLQTTTPATTLLYGTVTLTRLQSGSNTWICSQVCSRETGSGSVQPIGGGSKSLSAELDRISINVTAGAFDAGSINVIYE